LCTTAVYILYLLNTACIRPVYTEADVCMQCICRDNGCMWTTGHSFRRNSAALQN